MINLYYNFYVDKLKERNDECNYCLNKLISNQYIDKYFISMSSNDENIFDEKFKIENLKKTIINHRPTYEDYFIMSNLYSFDNDINIIINSDCYIKESDIKRLYDMNENDFYCLSRWNITKIEPFGVDKKGIHNMSQDCWIWKGKPKKMKSNFKLGIKACDNAIAYQIKEAGYNPRNIPYYIRIYHYHFTYQNRIQENWHKEHYDNEPILFVDVEEMNINNIHDINEKIENERRLEEVKKTRTIKDICNEMLITPGDFRIFLNDIMIYDTEKEGKNKLSFQDDYIMINENKVSYRGIKIKKIV